MVSPGLCVFGSSTVLGTGDPINLALEGGEGGAVNKLDLRGIKERVVVDVTGRGLGARGGLWRFFAAHDCNSMIPAGKAMVGETCGNSEKKET